MIAAGLLGACGRRQLPVGERDGGGAAGAGGQAGDAPDGGGEATGSGGQFVGVGVVRHLTRTEYDNTVSALFGATVPSQAALLPPDVAVNGFDKQSQAQAIADGDVLGFEAAAESVVEAVFADPALKTRLIGCDLTAGDTCIRSTLAAFVPRAWRRPVQAAEIDRLMGLAGVAAADGGSPEAQLKLALRGALVSANFLYLIERDPDPASAAVHRLDDFELAARLSYFLWSSTPDDQLTNVAAQHRLQDDQVLTTELTRMLAAPRASALADDFAGQWLQMDSVASHRVDANPDGPGHIPPITAPLRQSMAQETLLFFQDAVFSRVPVRALLAADYAFVDQALASLYSVSGAPGSGFAKIKLAGTPRIGGLLGQASILTVTSENTTTVPSRRGFWVLDNLLCAGPSAAPADADHAAPATVVGQTQRQLLAPLQANPMCAGCHSQTDPIGLGLDQYDAIGRFRDHDDGGKPIDPSGQLANGPSFKDAGELAALLANDDRLARCVLRKLFTFALARPPSDAEIDYLRTLGIGNADALTKVITQLAVSRPFRERHGGMP